MTMSKQLDLYKPAHEIRETSPQQLTLIALMPVSEIVETCQIELKLSKQ